MARGIKTDPCADGGVVDDLEKTEHADHGRVNA